MNSFIKLEYVPYEETTIKIKWHVSNGNTATKAEYYHNLLELEKIANHLEIFPRNSSDKFIHAFGSERQEDRAAYYFRLYVFLHSSTGGSSMLFRFSNNRPLPDTEITEFCIHTEPAAINKLGKMFRQFSKLEDEVMIWSFDYQFIGDKSAIDMNAWKKLNA